MRFLSVTSTPHTLHTFMATLLPPVPAPVPGPLIETVAVAVPPPVEHEQRRPTAAPVAVVFTPPHVGQIIRVDMSTSSSARVVRAARSVRWRAGSHCRSGCARDTRYNSGPNPYPARALHDHDEARPTDRFADVHRQDAIASGPGAIPPHRDASLRCLQPSAQMPKQSRCAG